MTDVRKQLRATSDELLQDLEVLITLEQEKRDIPADDERLVALAARIDEIAARVTRHTADERELAESLNRAAVAGETEATAIEATPPRPIATILADWRSAERQASDAEAGSPERLEADARVDALRAEYRRAYEATRSSTGGSPTS
jgi:hypothetical protein